MIRKADLWLAAGWAGLVAAGVGLLIVPGVREDSRLRKEIDGLTAELAKPANGPEVIERLSMDLRTLREFGKGRMTPIPAESDVAGLMKSLSTTLQELGLDQRDVTTRSPKVLEDASSMPMSVTLSGPFPRIYEALAGIESLPRLVRMERLRISQDEARSGKFDRTGRVRAELSVEAFFSPRAVAAAPGGGEAR